MMAEFGPPSGSLSDSAPEDTLGDEFTGSFFGALMKNISTFDQAERLAHNLNLPNSEIQGLKKDVQNDPVVFAIRVLKNWNNNYSHGTFEDARRELALKLEQSGLERQANRVWPQASRVMSPQGSRPHTPVLNAIRRVEDADRVPLLAQNPPPDEEEEEEEEEEEGVEWEDNPPVRRKCSYKWLGCYGACLISLLLATAALIVLHEVPAVRNDIQPIDAGAGDTVQLRFNLDYVWLEQVTLEIKDECVGYIYVEKGTPCSEIQTLTEFGVYPNHQEPVYLVSGSQILFTIPSGLGQGIYVWITRGGYEASTDYENYGCYDHPSNMVCFEADHNSGSHVYPVTETSYYSVGLYPHVNHGIEWNFTAVKYNYMQFVRNQVLQHDDPVMVTLGNQFEYHEMCMLLQVSDESCNAPYHGKLTVTNITRRQDILLIPGLIMGIILVVLCFTAVVHCVCFRYNAVVRVIV